MRVNQHMKMAGFYGIGRPTSLAGLHCIPCIGFAKLDINTPGVRPAIKDRYRFSKKVQPTRAKFGNQLSAQVFIGQFVTNWNAVLAALSLAILPVLVLYLVFSRQLIRGITAGAVK